MGLLNLESKIERGKLSQLFNNVSYNFIQKINLIDEFVADNFIECAMWT